MPVLQTGKSALLAYESLYLCAEKPKASSENGGAEQRVKLAINVEALTCS